MNNMRENFKKSKNASTSDKSEPPLRCTAAPTSGGTRWTRRGRARSSTSVAARPKTRSRSRSRTSSPSPDQPSPGTWAGTGTRDFTLHIYSHCQSIYYCMTMSPWTCGDLYFTHSFTSIYLRIYPQICARLSSTSPSILPKHCLISVSY